MFALLAAEYSQISGKSLLFLSLFVLAIAPFIASFMSRQRHWVDALDGFVFTTVGFMIIGHILPECVESAGYGVLCVALVGIVGPLFIERTFKNTTRKVQTIPLILGLIALLVHGISDGVILGTYEGGHTHDLSGEQTTEVRDI